MDEHFSVSSRSIAFRKNVWGKLGGYPEWLTLAADDTIFWKMIKKQGFKYEMVTTPLVYWGRHHTNKAFAREAYRYGLGDGESRINYRNFWSSFVETTLRYMLFLSLFLMALKLIFGHFLPEIPIGIYFLPLLFLPGLRSYINAWKSWRIFKSGKYNFNVFLNALLQLEMSRIQYFKGYIQGLLDWDPIKKEGRKQLWQFLGK